MNGNGVVAAWKKGPEVRCCRNHRIAADSVIDHGVPTCGERIVGQNERASLCGLGVYVVVLSRSPLIFAWADISAEQRRYILDNNLTPLQALWYLRLPAPMEQSA